MDFNTKMKHVSAVYERKPECLDYLPGYIITFIVSAMGGYKKKTKKRGPIYKLLILPHAFLYACLAYCNITKENRFFS